MDGVTILRAEVSHLPWLRHLFAALVGEQSTRFAPPYPVLDGEELDEFTRTLYRHLSGNPGFAAWLAAVDGRAVGFLAGEIWERAIGKPHRYAAPHYLYVEPAHRGAGVARALIATGVQWLAAQGIDTVELASLAADDGWLRRGWRPYLTKFYLPLAEVAALTVAPHASATARTVPEPQVVVGAARPTPRRRRAPRAPKRRRGHVNGADVEATDGGR